MFGILFYDFLAGALSGLAAQQVLYRITEVPVIPYLKVYGLINILLFFLLSRSSSSALNITVRALAINFTYNTSLIALTAIRRLFFHPLAGFPGSRWSAISTIHGIILLLCGRRTQHTYDEHQVYGDFVRTGPNELSINNVEAIEAVYARRHQHVRGPFYAASARGGDGINMFMYRGDPGTHGTLRRIWEKGMNAQQLKDYIPMVHKHVGIFINTLRKKKQILGDEFMELARKLAFDISCDIAFGKDEGLLSGKGEPELYEFMNTSVLYSGLATTSFKLGSLIPLLPCTKEEALYHQKKRDLVQFRASKGPKWRKDLFQNLIAHFMDPENPVSKISGPVVNSELLFFAATETTGGALTATLRELVKYPNIMDKLREELDEAFSTPEDITAEATANLPYLTGVIKEGLRLRSPVRIGAQYKTPKEGMYIDGTFIPGLVDVRVNPMALMADERYFARSKEFIPERWTTRPALIKDKRAFIPFSTGAHVCPGKGLVQLELKLMIALIVKNFDVHFHPTYNERAFEEGMAELLVVRHGPMPLTFTPRYGRQTGEE